MSNALNRKVRSRLAACMLTGVGMALTSSSAFAAIVHSGPVNIAIPDNIDGIYFNVVTGASGVVAPSGWDLNPYSAAAGQFSLWGPTTNTWFPSDGVVGGNYNLAAGTLISGAATVFFRPGGATNIAPQLNLNSSNNLLGFRFVNESNANANHFGWIRLSVGATAGTRAIVEYAYENVADTAIAAGDTGVAAGNPEISVSPTSLGFGSLNVGGTSGTQSFTVTNNGTASGTVNSITVTGPFSVTGGSCALPATLAAGASCNVNVVFQPVASGAATGTATLVGTLSRGVAPVTSVNLSGTGTAPSTSFAAGALNFGTAGSVQFLTITNTGSGPSTVGAPSFTGPFALGATGSCPAAPFTLNAGQSCTFAISFTASAIGSYSGSINVTADGTPLAAALTGNIAIPAPAFIPVDSPWALGLMIALMGLFAGIVGIRRKS